MRKKLLILGGTSISQEIVWQAHKMGLDVYVTDYFEDSPAKKIADKSFMVSASDVEAVTRLIKEERIDGVITGYADVLLPYYVEICRRSNLPCYATAEAINITTDKEKFKKLCRAYNVPVVPEYTLEKVESGNVKYPVLVKPVDNSGARGIYICHNRKEFDVYYQKSLTFSPSKSVLIERYMQGNEATIFYFLHKGQIYLMGMGDRHMKRFDDKFIPLPIGYTFPAISIDSFMKEENENVCNMFRSLSMKEGMVFMQAFVEDGQCIIYEMGYRLTGSLEPHLFEHAYNFNTLEAMINYAVDNEIDIKPLQKHDVNNCCMANLTLLLRAGYLKEYEGLDEVRNMDGVLHVFVSREPGTLVEEKIMGTLAQVAVRVLLYADTKEELIVRMDQIKSMIKVLDDKGNNILIENYTYSEIIPR